MTGRKVESDGRRSVSKRSKTRDQRTFSAVFFVNIIFSVVNNSVRVFLRVFDCFLLCFRRVFTSLSFSPPFVFFFCHRLSFCSVHR